LDRATLEEDAMESEPEGPIPVCCGREMTLIRSGRRANFAIWIWRCATCERFESTNRRYDGQSFWVGAMGDAVAAKIDELIADSYGARGGRPG
jgi:hypothetical protein